MPSMPPCTAIHAMISTDSGCERKACFLTPTSTLTLYPKQKQGHTFRVSVDDGQPSGTRAREREREQGTRVSLGSSLVEGGGEKVYEEERGGGGKTNTGSVELNLHNPPLFLKKEKERNDKTKKGNKNKNEFNMEDDDVYVTVLIFNTRGRQADKTPTPTPTLTLTIILTLRAKMRSRKDQ